MPTYEYQCGKCGHRFSEFQKITDPPIRDCPKCKAKGKVEQIITGGAGLIFKGSGFYATDYKRSPSKEPGKAATEPKSSNSTTTDSKSDK